MAAKRQFTASFTGLDQLAKNCAMLRRKFPEALERANQETANEIFAEARRIIQANDSYASGELYDSIEITVSARGMAIYVASTSHYAPYVEFGTRPHFPPVDAIRRWCRLKGIPETAAYPICLKIAERGTAAQPFMRPALAAGRRNHLSRLRALISRAVKGTLKAA